MFTYALIAQWLRDFLIFLLIFWNHFSPVRSIDLDEYGRTPLSKNITGILDRLVNNTTYDKRLRPNYGGEPVEVGITIFVSSISAVSEVEMDYTLDIYLRQHWADPRLAFNATVDSITIDVEYMKSIWVPDTFFPNEKKSYAHLATTHNSFLRITRTGQVATSQRLTVTAACTMNLLLFPLDSQECNLEIESYGYSTEDIIYIWFNKENSVKKEDDLFLPQFQVRDHKINRHVNNLTTGSYSRLQCKFLFVRAIGFYMIQIYLPSSLIVVISWVSFWLSRDATPARVALGVTTVLTMTTLMTTTNAAMPKVSYIKSIDVYLGTCFLMVFSSLLEYAAVGYLNKRLKMRREIDARRQNESAQQVPSSSQPVVPLLPPPETHFGGLTAPPPMTTAPKLQSQTVPKYPMIAPTNVVTPMRTDYGSVKFSPPTPQYGGFPNRAYDYNTNIRSFPDHYAPPRYNQNFMSETAPLTYGLRRRRSSECDCDLKAALINAPTVFPPTPSVTTYHQFRDGSNGSPPPTSRKLIPLSAPKLKRKHEPGTIRRRRWDRINPSSIDKYSRVIFPLAFAIFNAIYWLVYVHISKKDL